MTQFFLPEFVGKEIITALTSCLVLQRVCVCKTDVTLQCVLSDGGRYNSAGNVFFFFFF